MNNTIMVIWYRAVIMAIAKSVLIYVQHLDISMIIYITYWSANLSVYSIYRLQLSSSSFPIVLYQNMIYSCISTFNKLTIKYNRKK